MKNTLLIVMLIFCQSALRAQVVDTTIYTEFEIANREYNTLTPLANLPLLDRAVTIDRSQIKRMREDSTSIKNSQDFMMLYHSFNLSDPLVDRADSTFEFTQRVFNYWNDVSAERGRFTLPIGVIYKEATFIKDESYQNGDLIVNTNQLDDGWQLSTGKTFADISENNSYFAIAPTYDIPIYDQEISFVLTEQFVNTDQDIDYVILNYGVNSYTLYFNDTADVQLIATDTIFNFDVHFTNGVELNQSMSFVINDAYFDEVNELKASLFTGGKYTFFGDGVSLRYGIIWGNCNNTGKLNKPFFMLHGFRPNIQVQFPSLSKLYKTKFNFKGDSLYGSDGFVDLLVKNGYDVVIMRIDPGHRSIRRGGEMLANFFKQVVEPQKLSIRSKHENIVLGFSMGGHYWRHMLMKMQYEHLNENNYFHHHTRLWLPIDSPLHGANNPLAHQFATKSLALKPAGIGSFNIVFFNMLSAGSQEMQRYDVNGYAGNDGAPHRFHQKRRNYNDELENTYYLGSQLTKYRGFPSATRNVAVSVGSYNNDDYVWLNAGDDTYRNHFGLGIFIRKKWDVELFAAKYKNANMSPQEVYHRKVSYSFFFSFDFNLVDDSFYLNEWLELDNSYGSYINSIWKNVNVSLRWNSPLSVITDYAYNRNITFVPTLSALAINPSEWPNNMRYDMRAEGLMFDELSDDTNDYLNFASKHFGYPHLGRPNDYQTLTPMDAIYINENTYEHIALIDDENGQNDQSELISFLLNEVEPWYLDLQNQNLGEYARSNYTYTAHYQARNLIRMSNNSSPKTPFGDYNILANVDAEYQSGEIIELKPGTHIQAGAIAHLYISSMCYWIGGGRYMSMENDESNTNQTSDVRQEYSNAESWTIYPNPSTNKMTIKSKFAQKGDLLYIYTMMGNLLGKVELDKNNSASIKKLVGNHRFVLVQWHSNGVLKGTRKLIIQ